jgi:hypothetical protein
MPTYVAQERLAKIAGEDFGRDVDRWNHCLLGGPEHRHNRRLEPEWVK